jgi:hypothetical protein|tara:strand:- start:877 stop:1095 length:219 start_codon:yes stop_codon:yes gene_type:complete
MAYILGLWAVAIAIAGLIGYMGYVVFLTADGWITVGTILFFLALYGLGIGIVGMSILSILGIAVLGYAARNG